MKLSPKQNAHIAMERFRIQSYNWDKTTPQLREIYGVGDKCVRKMRETVGVLPPKERIEIERNKAMALFKCNPEHHKLGYRKIAPMYGVTHTWAQTMIREVCGNRVKQKQRELDELVCSHPDFGISGEIAPIPHVVLAKELGVKDYAVGSRRRDAGILPYRQVSYMLSDIEIRSYDTCALTKSWGRPAGIDRHLERLHEKMV